MDILYKKRENYNFKNISLLWVCSNDPEVCGFVTNDLKGGKLSITKCPSCEDGYLVVKRQVNSEYPLLGCTNYKSDKTGCNMVIHDYEFTQDKEEFMIRFKDPSINLDNILICNHKFKNIINIIIWVIKTYENYYFSVGPGMLFSILSGQSNTTIIKNNMTSNPYFGYINPFYRKKFYALLKALQESKIISIDESDYGRIKLLKDNLNDNDYKLIFACLRI